MSHNPTHSDWDKYNIIAINAYPDLIWFKGKYYDHTSKTLY
jgi:hypothetical protein